MGRLGGVGGHDLEIHGHPRQRDGVAQRDQVAGPFRALYAGDAGNAQHVTLFGCARRDQRQSGRQHLDAPARSCDAVGGGLGGDVDHMGLALGIKMGEGLHDGEVLKMLETTLNWVSANFTRASCSLKPVSTTLEDRMNKESQPPAFWRDRIKASAIHLGISLTVAVLAGALVFGVWYPYPYREISGGRELFLILVTVDVILGPLITLAVFNRVKPWPVLRRDLMVVAALQLAALGYGLWTVSLARPVHIVFEVDRLSVVHAVEIDPALLAKTPPGITALPLTGPTRLSLRPFKDSQEKLDATLAALQGVPLAGRPDLWQPYANAIPDILKAAKPVRELKARHKDQSQTIDELLRGEGRNPENVVYLPLIGRKSFWTAFLDPVTADIVATLPLDPF